MSLLTTFVPNYPPDGSSLGNTKSTVRGNLNGTFAALSIDHYNQNSQCTGAVTTSGTPGYHGVIHMQQQGSAPGGIAGTNQLFAMVPPSNIPPGGDVQLFHQTASLIGGLSQMTGSQASPDGYAWCAGILFQWGFNPISNSGPVLFPVEFPNKCFNVIANLVSTGNPGNVSSITIITPLSELNFKWGINGGISGFTGFFWSAIGN